MDTEGTLIHYEEDINRIKVEFKDAYQPLLLQGSYYINRIKVEFKDANIDFTTMGLPAY